MDVDGVMDNDDMSEADYVRNEELCNSVLHKSDAELKDKNKIWTKYDGSEIHISAMNSDHIINCLNMLERNGYEDDTWTNIFLKELKDRNIMIKATSKTIVIYEMIKV